jgi:glycosyltransferase involved in cell wall biosynthesis
MRKLFYLGLEPLKSRYTEQLSCKWMPNTFVNADIEFINVSGDSTTNDINVGVVLDAVGRGIWSLNQCKKLLEYISKNEIKNNDIIFLQDFFTAGLDAVWYALDLYGIKVKCYAMLHAQSVDEYDFTYDMKSWIRWYELGIDSRLNGIFVASTIHKEQLRSAGFKAPIQVLSLPIMKDDFNYDIKKKKNIVVFTSRLDKEKNPYFMLEVAKKFLEQNEDWEWIVTTSSNKLRSNLSNIIDDLYGYANINNRFKILVNLSKEEYYDILSQSKIHFNSSLQDYVSWTILESTLLGCDIVFPAFRSFIEFISADRLYQAFDTYDAIRVLNEVKLNYKTHNYGQISDIGRQFEAYIILNDIVKEYNIWHEYELIKKYIHGK